MAQRYSKGTRYTVGDEHHDAYWHVDFVVVAVTDETVTVRDLPSGEVRTHRTTKDERIVRRGKCPRRSCAAAG